MQNLSEDGLLLSKICFLCLKRAKIPLKSNKKRRLGTISCILFCVLIWRREIFCCKATKRRRSMVCEEAKGCVVFAPRVNPWTPQDFLLTFLYANKKGYVKDISFFVAQRKGFEPLYTFLHNTISNRARSTAPPSLQTTSILYIKLYKKSTVFDLKYEKFPPRFHFPRRRLYLH